MDIQPQADHTSPTRRPFTHPNGPVVETVRLRDADELRYYRSVWYLAMQIRDRGGADEVIEALVALLSRTRSSASYRGRHD